MKTKDKGLFKGTEVLCLV